MNYKLKASPFLLALPVALAIPVLTSFAFPVSAQMTDQELNSTMGAGNLQPGYFDPDLSDMPESVCVVSVTPLCAFLTITLPPSKAGSWLETNPNHHTDANGDAMKDSSRPYFRDTWRDTNYDAIPDQSYDKSFYSNYEEDTNGDGIYDWSSYSE